MSDQTSYDNWVALAAKATAAITSNVTFITNTANATFPLSNAEQADLVNQVVALTRQVDAIIRVILGELTDTTGT